MDFTKLHLRLFDPRSQTVPRHRFLTEQGQECIGLEHQKGFSHLEEGIAAVAHDVDDELIAIGKTDEVILLGGGGCYRAELVAEPHLQLIQSLITMPLITMNMNPTLKNKRALVTGGSRGIGAAIVQRLASEGADVALIYSSSPDQANQVAQAAQALDVRSLTIQTDSGDASTVITAVEQTANKLGGIDILINNAGVSPFAPLDDFKLADFDRTIAVNVRAVFVATQAAVRHMQAGGRIINIGSINAERIPFLNGGCMP